MWCISRIYEELAVGRMVGTECAGKGVIFIS